MPVDLPAPPRATIATPRDLDFGVNQVPPIGGQERRYDRLGSRHIVDYQLPAQGAACARAWIANRHKAKRLGTTVRIAFPQADASSLIAVGTPLVNGASQTGTSLVIDGCTPSITIEKGRALSIIVGGRSYLYFLTDDVVVNGSGQATLLLDVMLRASPANNAVVELAAPIIEGFVDGLAWTVELLTFTEFTSFAVREIA